VQSSSSENIFGVSFMTLIIDTFSVNVKTKKTDKKMIMWCKKDKASRWSEEDRRVREGGKMAWSVTAYWERDGGLS
jgi:hypothetical protein